MDKEKNDAGKTCMKRHSDYHLHLFDAFGIELEYMIVQRDTLNILPIADWTMHAYCGEWVSNVDKPGISFSNELAMHVFEMKMTAPDAITKELVNNFQKEIHAINQLLHTQNAMLMPTAMHPWMDPHKELKLWPHEQDEIYQAFNRIFNCQGHGWANLQSSHINLPFANEEEFVKLHAAIRLLLPIIPGLAASSPIVEGCYTGYSDTRLKVYRSNSKLVPSIGGNIIPEVIHSYEQYEEEILQKMYREIAPHDPHGILQHEWLNARGAITRFDRGAIEIRTIDVQECPLADIGIAWAIVNIIQKTVAEEWIALPKQHQFSDVRLKTIFSDIVRHGEHAVICDLEYLSIFGIKAPNGKLTAKEVWEQLVDQIKDCNGKESFLAVVQEIQKLGTLSSRIQKAIGNDLNKLKIHEIYGRLSHHLNEGTIFVP